MRRHPIHDYRSPCIYHITMKKASGMPLFSSVGGRLECPEVNLSPIGKVLQTNIVTVSDIDSRLKMLQYVIMPDHVHLLLRVMEYLDDPLGVHISKMRIRSLQMARDRGICTQSIFERNFHDRFLRRDHSLDVIFQYIRQNPYRLLVRRYFPDSFRRVNNLFVFKDQCWQAYGNMQLLDNPFKEAVICHRADAGSARERTLETGWMYAAANGGVLVSPFISDKEKDIRNKAEALGGKTVLITNEAFPDRYKPSGRNFRMCGEGRLLVIAPVRTLPPGRSTFLIMNALAKWICAWMAPQAGIAPQVWMGPQAGMAPQAAPQ